jgi:GTPase SAR1 family protein
VGNKTDLKAEREVATSEGENLARELGLEESFCEVSAKTGENIDEVFFNVVHKIRKYQAETWIQWVFNSIKRVFGGSKKTE